MSAHDHGQPESTESVRQRVVLARRRAAERWAARGWQTNAEVPGPVLRREFTLPGRVTALLDRASIEGR
jgi:magnesium chelatase family protein